MKLQIIGSGGMWHKENSASYLIDDHILIDMPNGSCKNLYNLGIKVEKIDNVLITAKFLDTFLIKIRYMDLKQRVLEYCKRKNIAVSRCEKECNLANGYFNQVKKRPSLDKIESITQSM